MSDTHAAKKPKTASTTGPPLYSELDLAQLTVDATLLGANETRFATVKYKDTRLVYQLAGVGEAMRVPFGSKVRGSARLLTSKLLLSTTATKAEL